MYYATFCERFQFILNHSFIFLITQIVNLSHVFYLILTWKFQYFPNNDIWRKKIDPKSSTIFSTKQLEIWLNTPTWIYNLGVGMTTGRVFSGTRPAPNGMGLKFNKRVFNEYENFFLNPRRVRVLPHLAPFTYKINFKI